jgi:hypothetical protein
MTCEAGEPWRDLPAEIPDAMTDAPIRIACYDDLVAAFRARKVELGLSDAALDERACLTSGHAGKLLGPSRERGIGAAVLTPLLDALGVDLIMVPNPEKLALAGDVEQRKASHVRTVHPRIGQEQIRRCRPLVLAEAARRAANARWADSTPEDRQAVVARLNESRAAKRASRRTRTRAA